MRARSGFLSTAIAAAAMGLAAPAHADNADTVFIDQLDRAGIEYSDPQDAISMAKKICDLLAQGRQPVTIARSVKMTNHHLSGHNAAQFVAISADTYCPASEPAVATGG
jgi:hypothetical protein